MVTGWRGCHDFRCPRPQNVELWFPPGACRVALLGVFPSGGNAALPQAYEDPHAGPSRHELCLGPLAGEGHSASAPTVALSLANVSDCRVSWEQSGDYVFFFFKKNYLYIVFAQH